MNRNEFNQQVRELLDIENEDLAYPKPFTYQNEAYKGWIRMQPCAKCGMVGFSVAHHERGLGGGGVGMKPPDYYCVPLCNNCHYERHTTGYLTFWEGYSPPMVVIEYLSAYLETIK